MVGPVPSLELRSRNNHQQLSNLVRIVVGGRGAKCRKETTSRRWLGVLLLTRSMPRLAFLLLLLLMTQQQLTGAARMMTMRVRLRDLETGPHLPVDRLRTFPAG